jgi:hypothetical protein
MKLLDLLKGKKKKSSAFSSDTNSIDIEDVKVAVQKRIKVAKIPRAFTPVLSFKVRNGIYDFEQPEYDLAEIGRIADVESYVQRAFIQKEGLMFKEGWEFIGKNPKTIKYIKTRLRQIAQASGFSTDALFRGLGTDIIGSSNSFLVKVRDEKKSGGQIRKVPGTSKKLKPVAAYFPMNAATVFFKRNDNGRIMQYQQSVPSGLKRKYPVDNVIHMKFRQKPGFIIGTPILIPVIDDIRALRRVEENVEMLVYQHLFPLFHYTVGTEKAPADSYADGSTEVDRVRMEIESMPAEGMIVTPERHSIEAIGAQGRALQVEGILKHLKKRVFSGLGVSSVDMGEGETSNRATADNMSRNLVDDVKNLQKVLTEQINVLIINELLLESAFDDPLSEDNIVVVQFHEVDLDAKIKVENHAINAFEGHAITHDELRSKFGKEPMSDGEWENGYWKKIQEPMTLMQSVDEPFLNTGAIVRNPNTPQEAGDVSAARAQREKEAKIGAAAKPAAKPAAKGVKSTGGQRAAKAKDMPSNQHGTKLSPEKRKSFVYSNLQFVDNIRGNQMATVYNDFWENTMHAIENGYFTVEWFKDIGITVKNQMIDKMSRIVRISFRDGFRSVNNELTPVEATAQFAILESRIRGIVSRLITNLNSTVNKMFHEDVEQQENIKDVTLAFDSLAFRNKFIYNSERNKARNYGVVRGLKELGIDEALVISEDNTCEICEERKGIISLKNITMTDIPCWHPNCKCTVVPRM